MKKLVFRKARYGQEEPIVQPMKKAKTKELEQEEIKEEKGNFKMDKKLSKTRQK